MWTPKDKEVFRNDSFKFREKILKGMMAGYWRMTSYHHIGAQAQAGIRLIHSADNYPEPH